MNPKKILFSELINKAALARQMWPDSKTPKTKLHHKMNEIKGQRITENDELLVIQAMEDLIKD